MKNKKLMIGIAVFLVVVLIIVAFVIVKICTSNNSDITGKISVGNIKVGNIKVGDVKKKVKKDVKEEYTFQDLEALDRFEMLVPVGELKVSKSSDSSIKVSATYQIAVHNQDEMDLVENNIDLKETKSGNSMKLQVVTKEEGEDLWTWADEKIPGYNVSANLEIQLPEQFVDYDIQLDVGSIYLNDLKGKINSNAGTGNVEVENCGFKDECTLSTDVGSVVVKLSEGVDEKANVTLYTDTGNVECNLNGNSIEFTEETETMVNACINNLYNVKASVDTGSVKFA